MFSCATPIQSYLIASVFGGFHSLHRFLSGYMEGPLATSEAPEQRLLYEQKLLAEAPHTSCPNGEGLLLKQLLQFQDWQVFSPLLEWEREENKLNPGNALSWTWQFISKTEPQIIFNDTACIHIRSMWGPIQGLPTLRFPIRSGSKARFSVQWKFEGAFQIWFQSKSNLSEIFSGVLLNWKFPKPFSCSVIITAKMSIDFTKQW